MDESRDYSTWYSIVYDFWLTGGEDSYLKATEHQGSGSSKLLTNASMQINSSKKKLNDRVFSFLV